MALTPHPSPEWLDRLPFDHDTLTAIRRSDTPWTVVGPRYGELHATLAKEFARTKAPDPHVYMPDVDAYLAAVSARECLVSAEAWLRQCRDFERGARDLPHPLPLTDGAGLVSMDQVPAQPLSDQLPLSREAPSQPTESEVISARRRRAMKQP